MGKRPTGDISDCAMMWFTFHKSLKLYGRWSHNNMAVIVYNNTKQNPNKQLSLRPNKWPPNVVGYNKKSISPHLSRPGRTKLCTALNGYITYCDVHTNKPDDAPECVPSRAEGRGYWWWRWCRGVRRGGGIFWRDHFIFPTFIRRTNRLLSIFHHHKHNVPK